MRLQADLAGHLKQAPKKDLRQKPFYKPDKTNVVFVSWSRVVADHELLVVFNTDEINVHELYSTLNPNLRTDGEELRLLFSYTPESGLEHLESPRYASQD